MRVDLPFELIYSIAVPTWHSLFATWGYPAEVGEDAEHAAIAEALRGADIHAPLARALFMLLSYATPDARSDVYRAAEALKYSGRWPEAVSAADLIAQILVLGSSDREASVLASAAKIVRDRSFRPWSAHVYFGAARGDHRVTKSHREITLRWTREFSEWARARDFGEVVELSIHDEGGTLSFAIVHEERLTAMTVARNEAGERCAPKVIVLRPLRSHLVTYEATARRLFILTDCNEAVSPLATMAGSVLFADPRQFLDEPGLDLWALQEQGEEALAVRSMAEDVSVTAIGGTWHSGKSHAITARGRNFYEALERYKIRIEGGSLDLVTLRASVSPKRLMEGGGPSQCDVALRPPHQLTVSEPELVPLMHEMLLRAKIMRAPPRPIDFYSRQPWIAPEIPWIADEGVLGFAKLVAAGMLVPDPSNRSIAPPSRPEAGPTARAFPLRGTEYLALCPDPTIAPFVVEEKELLVYALSFEVLGKTVARELGLEGPAVKLDDDGVLFCGKRTLGKTEVFLWLLTRPIRQVTAERLRDFAGHGHSVLIVPEKRIVPNGLRQVPMPRLSGPWYPLLGATVRALRLEPFVEAPIYAPKEARIVLHRATGRTWVDGVRVKVLSELQFRLLDFLVSHAGEAVHSKDLADYIAHGNAAPDTARKAMERVLSAIEKSFAASDRPPPEDLKEFIVSPKHGWYMLTVSAWVE